MKNVLEGFDLEFVEFGESYPMEVHPAANLFPMIRGEELESLSKDIREHGQIESIKVVQKDEKFLLLDGRNRYVACKMANVEPVFELDYILAEWGDGRLVDWVVSKNLERRHLTASQRGMVASDAQELKDTLAAGAKERQAEAGSEQVNNLKQFQDDRLVESLPQAGEEVPEPSKPAPKTRDMVGEAFGVSGRTVSDSDFVKEHDPELAEEIRRGEGSVSSAAKKIRDEMKAVEEAINPPSEDEIEARLIVEAEKQVKKLLKNRGRKLVEMIHELTAPENIDYYLDQ